MSSDWAEPLADLRHHWGEAYRIEFFPTPGRPGRWVAQRRDSHGSFSARSADELDGLIRADYAAHPVPRDTSPCRLRPEGTSPAGPDEPGGAALAQLRTGRTAS